METERELRNVRADLVQAELTEVASQRWLIAYAAALKVAAVVLRAHAARSAKGVCAGKGRVNVWELLSRVSPGLAEWAGYFYALQGKREVVAAGAAALVSVREADDLVRDVGMFCDAVEHRLAKTVSRADRSVMPVAR